MRRENTLFVVQNHFDFAQKFGNFLGSSNGGCPSAAALDLGYRSSGLLVQESVNKQWS